ncbi:hypothetical protein C5B89_12100 [Haloferax sp. Atlit-47N]|jgi:hypothetical protein|nr:hypothetical protein C5B89_12100 [Haloferax sp. Atlit-47N]
MSIETSDLISLLEVIILTFTAFIYISQAVLRLFLDSENLSSVSSQLDTSEVDLERNFRTLMGGVAVLFPSAAIISVFIALSSTPDQVETFIIWMSRNQQISWGLIIATVVVIAIGLARRNKAGSAEMGIYGMILLSGSLSFLLVTVAFVVNVLRRSPESVFFVSIMLFAIGMIAFALGLFQLGNDLLGLLENT